MKEMKIAIIDNYISNEFVKEMTGEPIKSYHVIDGCCLPYQDSSKSLSHGSVCAAIMVEFSPQVEHIGISVASNSQDDFSIPNICLALDWCYKNQIQYICMSIGTNNWLGARPMQAVTKALSESGSTLICAVSPERELTYPACYPWVIAVSYEEECKYIMQNIVSCSTYDVVVGYFHSETLRKLSQHDNFFLKRSSSMAVPFFLGQLIKSIDISALPYEYPHKKALSFDYARCTTPIVSVVHENINKIKEFNLLLQNCGYMSALISKRLNMDWTQLNVRVNDESEITIALNAVRNANIILFDADGLPDGIGSIWDLTIDLCTYSFGEALTSICNFFNA